VCKCDRGFQRVSNGSVWICVPCQADRYCIAAGSTSPAGSGSFNGCTWPAYGAERL
jgi:hypothetical protein